VAITASTGGARYRSFRELTVWQQAMAVAVDVHALTGAFPPRAAWGLGAELCKTARSIPSNVAEGFNRHSRRSYCFHVTVALGSQAELETQLELAQRLGYLSDTDSERLQSAVASVGRLLHGLRRALVRSEG